MRFPLGLVGPCHAWNSGPGNGWLPQVSHASWSHCLLKGAGFPLSFPPLRTRSSRGRGIAEGEGRVKMKSGAEGRRGSRGSKGRTGSRGTKEKKSDNRYSHFSVFASSDSSSSFFSIRLAQKG